MVYHDSGWWYISGYCGMLAVCWRYVGGMLAVCWRYVGSILAVNCLRDGSDVRGVCGNVFPIAMFV